MGRVSTAQRFFVPSAFGFTLSCYLRAFKPWLFVLELVGAVIVWVRGLFQWTFDLAGLFAGQASYYCRNLIKKPWAFIRVLYMNPTILGVIGPGVF